MALISKRGFTLLELLIAMVLLVIIMLGFVSIDLFSRHHLFTADKRTKLQNEVSLVLEHMSKSVMRATGNVGDPGLLTGTAAIGEPVVDIRVDELNPPTPGDYSDDTWVAYGNNTAGQVFFCNNTAGRTNYANRDILVRHIRSFIVNLVTDPVTSTPIGVDINITAREKIAQPASLDNPEVNMRSTIYSRSSSVR